MKFLDKMKNLFTEEVEEEEKVEFRRETRPVETAKPITRQERQERQEVREVREIEKPPVVEEKKEEKFVFFSDEDFKDLEKKEPVKPKPVPKKEEKPLPYRGATPQIKVEEKKVFKPSPIISPVYGVLDKNYSKDEIVAKKVPTRIQRKTGNVTVDDIRNKAYGSVEDELKNSILGEVEVIEEKNLNDIDIFEEIDKMDDIESIDNTIDVKESFDEIFGELDNKKVEILDELDNKKDQILDELDSKKSDIITNDDIIEDFEDDIVEEPKKIIEREDEVETQNNEEDFEDSLLDDETIALSHQLESQKKKLEELNGMMDDDENSEDLNEEELFSLIDSMYDKKGDE